MGPLAQCCLGLLKQRQFFPQIYFLKYLRAKLNIITGDAFSHLTILGGPNLK